MMLIHLAVEPLDEWASLPSLRCTSHATLRDRTPPKERPQTRIALAPAVLHPERDIEASK